MLERAAISSDVSGMPSRGTPADDMIDLEWLLSAVKRQLWVFLLCLATALVVGAAYILTAIPLYTASTDILLDQRRAGAIDDAQDLARSLYDSSLVDSEVEVIRSERVASLVVDRLQLAENQAFMRPDQAILAQALSNLIQLVDLDQWLGTVERPQSDNLEDRRKATATETLQANMQVGRVLRTLVLRVSYSSPDPELAARVANAIAESYLSDQLESKYDATRRAGSWLEQRIAELRQQTLDSDFAVQRFKAEQGLVGADGRLLSDQQLAELNSQLMLARADAAQAEARNQRITAIIQAGQVDAAVTEALDSAVINNMRSRYLDASRRVSELSGTIGPNHIQVVRLRDEMREYERLIFDELRRIAESYESDYEVALRREQSLANSLAQLMGDSVATNETLVMLRELERTAETYRDLHQNFLQRYQESVQRQSFPITEARVISAASQPTQPSHPRTTFTLAFAFAVGAAVGAGIGGLREYRDRVFRTSDQVRSELGLEFIGMLGLVPAARRRRAPKSRTDKTELQGEGQLENLPPIMRHAIDEPLSCFAETLRGVKVAASLTLQKQAPKIIGVTSVLPGEGKSVVAKNLASLLAGQGERTLLIDADLRNPCLTSYLVGSSELGLLDAILGRESLNDLQRREPDTNLAFLPAATSGRVTHSADLLASPGMQAVLEEGSNIFGYIVVDLPPMGPVVDVRAVEPQIDCFLFVIEWGRTPRKVVQTVLDVDRHVRQKCLGVVFNKVDMDRVHLFETEGSPDYYFNQYTGYYRS